MTSFIVTYTHSYNYVVFISIVKTFSMRIKFVWMSSANNTDEIIAAHSAISWSSIIFTRYWCIIMFILGFIGHSLNICLFTLPALRFNSCARYLLASAIAGCVVIFVVVPMNFLKFGYNLSLFIPLVAPCKILTFLFSWARYSKTWW